MAEQNDAGLFREIDEELRQEQLTSFAKRYGKYAVAVVILIVAGVGGYKGWQAYDISKREEATRQFISAMNAESVDAALATYAKLSGDAVGDIPAVARMRQAALLAEHGDTASALDIYRGLASDNSILQEYRDLASLYAAVHLLDGGNRAEALERLTPLMGQENPWRHSARETAALAHLAGGDTASARSLLEEAASDPLAPEGVRRRSRQLLDSLGSS